MANEKVTRLIDRIEKAMRELAEATGVKHISAVIIDDAFMIDDYENIKKQKFSEFREDKRK